MNTFYFTVVAIHALCGGILLGAFVAALRYRWKHKRSWSWIFSDDRATDIVVWLLLIYHITGEYVLCR